MNSLLNIELPLELEHFREKIEATIKPYIKINAQIKSDLTPWQSKFGGNPYLPKDTVYPKDKNNKQLMFLAQINFEEVPTLEDFPQKGILQFYIADDDLSGWNPDDMFEQKGFRVLFFDEIIKDENALIANFDFLPEFEYPMVPESCSLNFEKLYAPMKIYDYQFEEKVFNENDFESKDEYYEIWDIYASLYEEVSHQIGGYPYFTQDDPRGYKYPNEDLILLFQLDSDDDINVMWGDAGVGNFFIKKENLINHDFSKVLYT
jgi:uncharacterized protein YwqG